MARWIRRRILSIIAYPHPLLHITDAETLGFIEVLSYY